ncbi:MAG: hypothetical protein QOI82_2319 [Actinomycetota bacterium]|jgi:hypothetical protein|nr:hypothetical protein [Actinomycetota bacterium]
MALSAEQWLQTHFFPVVASLPDPATVDTSSPTTALAVIASMRLLGAVDALVAVGALDAAQEQRCRKALEPKGVTTKEWTVTVSGFVSGLAQTPPSPAEAEPHQPDRLVRVLGSGQVFGLVEGEQAVLVAVELWERTVHADFLIAVSPTAEAARADRGRQLRQWVAKKQAGEVTDADRPPMSGAMAHPGSATTWLLDAGGASVEGNVVAGQGGGDWWRLRVQWDVAASEATEELVISGTEQSRVIGRSALVW